MTAVARSKAKACASPSAAISTSPPRCARTCAAILSTAARYSLRTALLPAANSTWPSSSSSVPPSPASSSTGNRTPKSKRTGRPGVIRRSSGLAVVNAAPGGSVDGSTFRMKLRPRAALPPSTSSRWKRPNWSVSISSPSTEAMRTPGTPRSSMPALAIT
ncbi:MAG: hypothetical protein DI597_12585 [Pseudoxanthomonas spadix]|nr:MAG: hypothetical protein DI597_12585 [Pseudoxanthomonas spadix]